MKFIVLLSDSESIYIDLSEDGHGTLLLYKPWVRKDIETQYGWLDFLNKWNVFAYHSRSSSALIMLTDNWCICVICKVCMDKFVFVGAVNCKFE